MQEACVYFKEQGLDNRSYQDMLWEASDKALQGISDPDPRLPQLEQSRGLDVVGVDDIHRYGIMTPDLHGF